MGPVPPERTEDRSSATIRREPVPSELPRAAVVFTYRSVMSHQDLCGTSESPATAIDWTWLWLQFHSKGLAFPRAPG